MQKFDIVIAMGRCIIEAIATRRLAIVTSPNELKFLVDSNNIYDAIEGNFASNDLQSQSLENIITQLKSLNSGKIKKITEDNYQIALKELDMLTNIYCIEESINIEDYEMKLIELINIQLEDLKNQREQNIAKYNNLLNELEYKKNIEYNSEKIIEEQKKIIDFHEKRNTELYNELSSVYNSKRFKLVNKIANTLTRKK